ncbi:MAG: glycogen debranching protein GlgX [Candidatus Binataceae bacterium]
MRIPTPSPEITASLDMPEFRSERGNPLPLGAVPDSDGVNFAIFSRHATGVELMLYRDRDDAEPFFTVTLDAQRNRTGDVWHVWIAGVAAGTCYAYRVDGPFRPEHGFRFNRGCVLIDPYARALTLPSSWDFERACGDAAPVVPGASALADDNCRYAAKAIIVERGGQPLAPPPRHPWPETIIYETHVRGFTIHPSSGVVHPGKYRGLIEKIPYLKDLGVTAVELLPVQEFNEHGDRRFNPLTGERLRNYWGYSTAAFFAPKQSYAADARGAIGEFRAMAAELHRAGIELILDVPLNHTAEGDEYGPTLSFRGLDNPIYYQLDRNPRHYRNYSGCGNTLNCSHPVVRNLILDCLRYWTVEMGADGFRFDLATILERGREGGLEPNSPLLEAIVEDPVLRSVKLIAEAWDAGGAYQLGSFPGERWCEWNGRYRDDVRRFWRGDSGRAAAMASRLAGSADIYQRHGKLPINSINFVTCHDGMTLRDLVTYARKHNEANGEDNRDGMADDLSANYGVEGESANPEIRLTRIRQMKNLMATLMLSRGVPVILGGDEFGRTQRGNNNPYCQDNEISWYDWRLLEPNRELYEFTRRMIAFRRCHPVLSAAQFYSASELSWFSPSGDYPNWDANEPTLGCVIGQGAKTGGAMAILLNAGERAVEFQLRDAARKKWRVTIDTGEPAPREIVAYEEARIMEAPALRVAERSLIVLEEDRG